MKKILVLHTKYRNLGGEDIAVSNEIDLLRKHYDVEVLFFTNSPFSIFKNSRKLLNKKIVNFNPDIIYIHNLWFAAGLKIFKTFKKIDCQVLIKFHNFRYFCTKTFFLKNHLKKDLVCLACGMERKKNMLLNNYYPTSFLKSMYVNYFGVKFFRIISSFNLKILVLTNFHKQFLIDLGIDPKKIFLMHNFLEVSHDYPKVNDSDYLIYAGRISKEKGVEELILSHSKSNLDSIKLKLVGEGPELAYLKKKYDKFNVEFIGPLSNNEVLKLIKNSKAVITATKLYEGQPTLLCEASKYSVPSIFPMSGGIKEFFPENYLLSYEQFNYKDLENKINYLEKQEICHELGKQNFKYIEELLSEDKIISDFENIINYE